MLFAQFIFKLIVLFERFCLKNKAINITYVFWELKFKILKFLLHRFVKKIEADYISY